MDFLRHFELVVDVAREQLLPRAALASPVGGDVFAVAGQAVTPAAGTSEWASLLAEFPSVSQPFTVRSNPAHGVEHMIETVGRPATAKFCRLDPQRLAAAKAEFQKMLDAGVVRRSNSCWSSPLHMVRKKDGGWRPCGDFRRLNICTTDNKYPLTNMGDLSSRLDGCTSKLDLQKGYFQVPVTADDIPNTAIITPFGLFEFLRMPFGLKNAGMTFQRLMDRIFFDLPFAFIYLDDLLVASRDKEDHRHHLRQVLQRLQDNGLVLNLDKCQFGLPSLEFLGHSVSAGGIAPLPARVEAIRAFTRPATVKELQAFLGLFNFYRRFVPRAAAIIRPLTDALRSDRPGTAVVSWLAAMQAAFDAARSALASTALLDHPAADAELSLVTDASASHVSGVLQQRRPGQNWQQLGFYSQKLSAAEERYSAFDRELLAVHNNIVHFRHLLEGRHFVVFTDHQPLVGALARASEPKSDRQRRQLSFISEFTADIRHIAGQANVVADTLSRPAATVVNQATAAKQAALPSSGSASLLSSGPQAGSTVGVLAAAFAAGDARSKSGAAGGLRGLIGQACLRSSPDPARAHNFYRRAAAGRVCTAALGWRALRGSSSAAGS
jgi:RNase H-like domain found in reverse transcriptase/Reverse transcriptase (RNA-dependent DNA polymerase)